MTEKNVRAYRDPEHPGNNIRPRIRCVGCGRLGCITAWGPWCFKCNVERMDCIGAKLRAAVGKDEDD